MPQLSRSVTKFSVIRRVRSSLKSVFCTLGLCDMSRFCLGAIPSSTLDSMSSASRLSPVLAIQIVSDTSIAHFLELTPPRSLSVLCLVSPTPVLSMHARQC